MKSSLSFQTVKKGLSGNALKVIAVIAMTVDHLAWIIFPGYTMGPPAITMHIIGRITAPVMMFFVSEGYHFTHNRKKYLARLLLFAVLSHIPYTMFSDFDFIPGIPTTSVIWPFAMGVLALMIDKGDILPNTKRWQRMALIIICLILALPSDWSTPAALAILFMGRHRGNFKRQMLDMAQVLAVYGVICGFLFTPVYGLIHLGIIIPIMLLTFYNGARGTVGGKAMKWLFYIYYPAHLLILGIIKT
ncbi:MAG: conjugal transfer protein TraX [Clostridiales bacterium]|nr:conjugal transfer protein TraX [Clostridiales bacterium]